LCLKNNINYQTLEAIERSRRSFNKYIGSYISVDKTDWETWFEYLVYCFYTTTKKLYIRIH